MSETSNQIRGHKANISNPRTSEESKESSRKMIEVLQDPEEDPSNHGIGDSKRDGANFEYDTGGQNSGNIIGGHKANLKNPRTSDEAKENSRKILGDMGA